MESNYTSNNMLSPNRCFSSAFLILETIQASSFFSNLDFSKNNDQSKLKDKHTTIVYSKLFGSFQSIHMETVSIQPTYLANSFSTKQKNS